MKNQFPVNLLVVLPLLFIVMSCSNKGKVATTDNPGIYTVLSSHSWYWVNKGCSENRERFSFNGNKITITLLKEVLQGNMLVRQYI
jgi:hypothetical protein